jgi:hypothetical protein
MSARDDEWVVGWAQPSRAASAETVCQHHGIDIRAGIHGIEVFL